MARANPDTYVTQLNTARNLQNKGPLAVLGEIDAVLSRLTDDGTMRSGQKSRVLTTSYGIIRSALLVWELPLNSALTDTIPKKIPSIKGEISLQDKLLLNILESRAVLLGRTQRVGGEQALSNVQLALKDVMLKQWKAISKAVNDVIALVAHDLRTPLCAVSGYLQLLSSDSNLTDDQRRYIEIAYGNSKLASRIVQAHLDLFKFEQTNILPNITTVNLQDSIKTWVEKLKEDDYVSINFQGDTAALNVNENLIGIAVRNLTMNAKKHGKDRSGRAEITISISTDTPNERVRISVSDKGKGIGDRNPEQLFALGQTDGGEDSYGLGLYIVKQIAGAHHGTVGAENNSAKNPGELGATFWIELPMNLPLSKAVTTPSPPAQPA